MSETSEDYPNSNKGVHINPKGIDCFPCRCNRKMLHRETKTTKDIEGKTVVNQIEDRSSWRVGSGRHATPEENMIFDVKINDDENIEVIDTGYSSRKPTPEDRLEKLEIELGKIETEVEKIETEVGKIEEEVDILKKNIFNSLD